MTNKKAGYISLVGRPNAGKSTLLNALVGQKIAGVSAKPQTTRNKILGICNHNESQLLFLDTPGMHRLRKAVTINSLMNKEAFSVIGESNVVVYMIDVTQGIHHLDEEFLKSIYMQTEAPVIVGISKVDKLKKIEIKKFESGVKKLIAALKKEIDDDQKQWVVSEIVHISAKNRPSLLPILDYVEKFLPEGPWMYPEDDLTDRPQRFIAGELIREKVFRQLGEEIPYHTAVRIDEMSFEEKHISIMASIIVARNSHKGMVIGKGGSKIKEIGTESRVELEELFGRKIFLDLQVKVDSGWTSDKQLIAEYSSLEFV